MHVEFDQDDFEFNQRLACLFNVLGVIWIDPTGKLIHIKSTTPTRIVMSVIDK